MLRIVILLTLGTFVAGCGSAPTANYDNVNLVDVRGTVLVDGTPVPGAVLEFRDDSTGLSSFAMTDQAGEYRLKFDSIAYGTEPGEKVVSISTTRRVLGVNSESEGADGEEGEEGEGGASAKKEERIPDPYRGKDSKLRATVTDSTGRMDFDLAANGTTTGPS